MTPRILAIDTSGEFASLTLLAEEPVEALLHSTDGFAHLLFDQVDLLLGRAGCRISDIDCFAATAGPGSFTGVRVALAAAKGLAEVLGKPVVAVSTLQAIAWHGVAPLRASLLDARRGEVYGAVYDARLELVRPEVVMPFPAWVASLPAGDLDILTLDPAPFTPHLDRAIRGVGRNLATAAARIARDRFLAGQAVDPAAVDANYVRRSDAELKWRDRAG